MSLSIQTKPIDPLRAVLVEAAVARGAPIPLVRTEVDVEITGPLAVVETRRVFRNTESASIEAVLTFPTPVHATFYSLEASWGGRTVKAVARGANEARQTYESAIDAGLPAVLHEEVLKGVHMLSVAHLAPDTEVDVRTRWAVLMTAAGGRASLRIPMTVGDIYGQSGLPDVDDLLSGGPDGQARLTVRADRDITVRGTALGAGEAFVPLNAPIDIEASLEGPAQLEGTAANGRPVRIAFRPLADVDAALSVAVLVDRSGSMSGIADRGSGLTKLEAVSRALSGLPVRSRDTVDLWQFDHRVEHVGEAADVDGCGASVAQLASRLGPPQGGTDIGEALRVVLSRSSATDILLITDGKSHALDVQALASKGRRISVVLVGEDSLEARVGHLAAATGGDLFVVSQSDFREKLEAVVRGLRSPVALPKGLRWPAESLSLTRHGAQLDITWGSPDNTHAMQAAAEAGHVAASLAIPLLPAAEAEALAVAEGLCSHLTSLVLVDEEAAPQAGLPALRKVALASPAAGISYEVCADIGPDSYASASCDSVRPAMDRRRLGWLEEYAGLGRFCEEPAQSRAPSRAEISRLARQIPWDEQASALAEGVADGLAEGLAEHIQILLDLSIVRAFAALAKETPLKFLIGVLAACADQSRAARRIARRAVSPDTVKEFLDVIDWNGSVQLTASGAGLYREA